ncbi:MAG: hypothetical protein HY525_16345 [Betaproteobacteria bacterium]|nr:hypothetical protein [Betaproteobacteria bacterium]
MKFKVILQAALMLAASIALPSAHAAAADIAKDYPNRPVRMIVPNAPGSSFGSVIAGESQWTLTPAAAVMSHVNSGRLRAVGHSLLKRSGSRSSNTAGYRANEFLTAGTT